MQDALAMTRKRDALGESTDVAIPDDVLSGPTVAERNAQDEAEGTDFAAKMKKADAIMRRYRSTLNSLAE